MVSNSNAYIISPSLSSPSNGFASSTVSNRASPAELKDDEDRRINDIIQERIREQPSITSPLWGRVKKELLKTMQIPKMSLAEFKELYKKKGEITPSYFVSTLQIAIYKLKFALNSENRDTAIFNILNDPTELGPVITAYANDPSMTEYEIAETVLKNISHQKRAQLKNRADFEKTTSDFIKSLSNIYNAELKFVMPDIVFRPESGLVFGYKNKPYVFLSNFLSNHGGGTRLREVEHNKKWFEEWLLSKGIDRKDLSTHLIETPIAPDNDESAFEGGAEVKYVKHGNSVDIICGHGFRTNIKAIEIIKVKLQEILGEDFIKVNFIPAKSVSADFYHLDTALKEIPIIKDGVIVDETIMYYPDAFDSETQHILAQRFPNALIITKEDVHNFACNSPTVNKSIIIDDRVSKELEENLKSQGLTVIRIDLSEFYKAGGGGKCLICELDKDLFKFDPEYNSEIQMIGTTKNIFDVVYVNDPYMKESMGKVNKGLAERQHQNLKKILSSQGMTIQLMDTSSFQPKFDFDILRKAVYLVLHNKYPKTYKSMLDEIAYEAVNYFGKPLNTLTRSELLSEIYKKYEEVFNSDSHYSWPLMYSCMHEAKRSRNILHIDNRPVEIPEDMNSLWE